MALRLLPKPAQSMEGVEAVDHLSGTVLVIGFGRFGQIASQPLIASGIKVSIIDTDTDMIRVASLFGMKVYYGDGTRLDILHSAGAATAEAILVCVDDKDAAIKIVELVKAEFPVARVLSRSFDRGHAIKLIEAGVDFQIREVFESALVFGGQSLREMGVDEVVIAETLDGVRERDRQRFAAQISGGMTAGRDLLLSNAEEQAKESGAVSGPSEPIMLKPDAAGAGR
jgi:glutathione-regulated potassium-efflux system protein KefB